MEASLVKALAPLIPGLEGVSVGGRTDRGVSATGQVISFWSRKGLLLSDLEAVLDSAAPGAIVCRSVERVPRWFHAQFSARWRRYVYRMPADPTVDVARADRMLGSLLGRHDFSAYARATPAGKSTVRKLVEARVRADAEGIRFDFKGESFLRKQIRVMVATTLREARAGSNDDVLLALAEANDRNLTAYPAEPEGLVLERIGY